MRSDPLQEAFAALGAGRYRTAVSILERFLKKAPAHPWGWHLHGIAKYRLGKSASNLRGLRRALALAPAMADFHNNFAETTSEAAVAYRTRLYRRTLAIDGFHAGAYGNLGARSGKALPPRQMLRLARRFIAAHPGSAAAHHLLASLRIHRSDAETAHIPALRASRLAPGEPGFRLTLGVASFFARRLDVAEALFRSLMALPSLQFPALQNLGYTLSEAGRFSEALTMFRRVASLEPAEAKTHHTLGNALNRIGATREAYQAHRRTVVLAPANLDYRSSLVMDLAYLDGTASGTLLRAAAAVAETARPDRPVHPARAPRRELDGKLRVGILSADFRRHPLAETLRAFLPELDRRQFELHLYGNIERPDQETLWFSRLADRWHSIFDSEDSEAAEAIAADGLDVLIAIAGHTRGARPGVLARRPAPVQASLFDICTSANPAIAAFIGDDFVTPVGGSECFTEHVVRLPLWCAFRRPDSALRPGPPPSARRGHLTFGSFNNPAKLSSATAALWSRLVQAVPGARLRLKFAGVFADPQARAYVIRLFEQSGLDADRLELDDQPLTREEHLRLYDDIDIALDPLTFNGCNTSFDALWMGVPVLTLPGDRFISRMTAGFLREVMLEDWIAGSAADFVERGSAFARDAGFLARLRAELRQRVLGSRLVDSAAYARSLEACILDLCRERQAAAASPPVCPPPQTIASSLTATRSDPIR